jgi:hypothetical protein
MYTLVGRYCTPKLCAHSYQSECAHNTLAARGLEEHVRITLIFSRIISFMLFTVLLSHVYFFRRISDSQFTS